MRGEPQIALGGIHMKTKKLIRLFTLLVALCLIVPSASATATNEKMVQPRYTNITQFYADLELTSGWRADCYAYVKLANSTDSANLTMELQRSSNGSSWSTIKAWTTSGRGTVTLDKSYYVTSGYSYRVVATVEVYTSAGTLAETASAVSQIAP